MFKLGDITGVSVEKLTRHEDERGWLCETFRKDECSGELFPVMGYAALTRSGQARGPHEHREQTDIFLFLGPGSFRIYLWDWRKHSETFKNHLRIETQPEIPMRVVVPPGVVHAYKNVGYTDAWVHNYPNRLYMGRDREHPVDEIRYEDDPESPFLLD